MTCVTLCNMYINSCLIESCTDCLFFSPLRRLFHYLLDFGALGHIVDCYLPIILRTGPGPTAVSRGLKTAWGSQQNLRPYKRRGSPVRSGEIRWPHWAMAMLGESRTNSSLMFFTWQNKYCNIYIYEIIWTTIFCAKFWASWCLLFGCLPKGSLSHVDTFLALWSFSTWDPMRYITNWTRSGCDEITLFRTCVLLLVFNNTCLFFKIPRHWERTTTPFSPEKSWKTYGKPGWQSIRISSRFIVGLFG